MQIDSKTKQLSKSLWNLSYPTMISSAIQSAYDIFDMIWVGQISSQAQAGVTIFTTIYTLFTVLNEIAGSSSISVITQSYGRGDKERTQKIAEQTISFKIVLAILSGLLLLIFLKPLFNLYTKDPLVKQAAMEYGYIRIFFLPIMFSSYSVNTIFRCIQDTKTPMRILTISGLLNFVLDPIFIFDTIPATSIPGLGLGVFGAALSTVIASVVSFLIGFTILYRGKRGITVSLKGMLKFDREIDIKLLVIGLPNGIQLFVRQAFNAIMIKFVASYGTAATALAGIYGKLNQFFLLPLFGVSNAGSALAGSALGRNNIKEAEKVVKLSALMDAGMVAVIVGLAFLLARPLMRLFNPDPLIIWAGVDMIRIMAIGIVIAALAAGLNVAFTASGYNRPQLYSTIISRWLVQLPLMYLVTMIFQLPLNYLWVVMVIAEIAELFVKAYFVNRGECKFNRVYVF